ncbi:MAG: hypothetical protein L7V86_10575 [Verrucomicrobiales bacterium]|nr:hypothetical protein [Verrucomicrobiales bacterium]
MIEEAQSLLAKGDFESVFEKMKPYSTIRDEEVKAIVDTAKILREQAVAKQDEDDRKARIAEIESALRGDAPANEDALENPRVWEVFRRFSLRGDAPANEDALVRELLKIDPGNEKYATAFAGLRATDSAKKYKKVKDDVRKADWITAQDNFEGISADGYELEALTTEVETLALEVIRPIPANDFEANLEGYKFLSILRPDKTEYKTKTTHYENQIDHARRVAIDKLNRTEDRVEGVTWFKHPSQPKYLNSRSTAFFYIGRRGESGPPFLRMKIQYTSSDWIFTNKVYAWDGGKKTILVSDGFKRDNNANIWEWKDVSPTSQQVETMRTLANSNEAVLRFEGDKYWKDVTLSASDKGAIRDVLFAFEVMKSVD